MARAGTIAIKRCAQSAAGKQWPGCVHCCCCCYCLCDCDCTEPEPPPAQLAHHGLASRPAAKPCFALLQPLPHPPSALQKLQALQPRVDRQSEQHSGRLTVLRAHCSPLTAYASSATTESATRLPRRALQVDDAQPANGGQYVSLQRGSPARCAGQAGLSVLGGEQAHSGAAVYKCGLGVVSAVGVN